MLIGEIMAALRLRHEAGPTAPAISLDVLDRWRAGSDLSRFGLLDEIAAELALGFHRGELAFAFCDDVVNALVWNLYADAPPPAGAEWPELFWQVYLAFDAGEYHHAEQPHADPVQAYTQPLIAAIAGRLRPAGDESSRPAT